VTEATYTYAVLGFLALCIAVWFWRERDRARRGERLIAATRRMAAGDLDARAGVRGHDDLGVLADAVAQMAGRLKTLGTTYQERQDWFGLLLEHSSDLIFTLDGDWHIGFLSPSLPRFLGWPMDHMIRRPLAEFLHPDDAEAVFAAFGAISVRPQVGESIAFRLLHVDGSWRSVEAIASPPRNWSGADRIVVTARDIGARERLERELSQAQQMAASRAASPTTSTTCSPRSRATPASCSATSGPAIPSGKGWRRSANRRSARRDSPGRSSPSAAATRRSPGRWT